MPTYVIPGKKVENHPEDIADQQALAPYGITIVRRQEVGATLRGAAETQDVVSMTEEERRNTVVELKLDGGVVQYMRLEDLENEGAPTRGPAGEAIALPVQLQRGPAQSRGVFDWGVRVFRFFKGDQKVAALAVEQIIRHFDDSQQPAPGLYRIGAGGEMLPVADGEPLDIALPWLVLIHGTFSSTDASFGGLFRDEQAKAVTPEWKQLYDFYHGRVLALQHKTLSVSPVDNAVYLADRLPDLATLHLVTHSRGGLIGELLSLGDVGAANFAPYEKYGKERLKQLRDFTATLQRKKFRIEKFVRVAGPARGTILASNRLDLYLSILLNLFGAIPGLRGNPLYGVLKATTIELVRARADARQLPGLEAMMPESPFVQFLNQGLRSDQSLAVIAGDAEGDSFWQRLKLLGTDIFYLEEHDLVVNTQSMFRGLARTGPTYGFYHRGGAVNHFNYFSNPRTRIRLTAWLTSKEPDPEFQQFNQLQPGIPVGESRGLRAADADPNSPVLIVVPDIFGSTIGTTEDDVLWPDVAAIARGGFDLHAPGRGARMLIRAYAPIITGWGASHEVVPFPWDWRASMANAATDLAKCVNKYANRRVFIVAHGAGGLIVHRMAATEDAWKRVERVLLLATPQDGMFAAVDACSPSSRLVRMLSMADGVRDPRAIAQELVRCQAVLESAPRAFLDSGDAWAAAGAVKPDADALARAAAFRAQLGGPVDKFVAVTGRAPETLAGAEADSGTVLISPSGDGHVLDNALHPQIPLHRVEAAHGDLPAYGGAFTAYRELLASGATTLLPTPQKLLVPAERRIRREEPLLFPGNDELMSAAIGRRGDVVSGDDVTITISVTHGDVKAARFPVAVGHYLGDSIVSAEAKLDCLLGQRLSRRFNLGLYPGEVGTFEVVAAPKEKPPGALVIGLGQVGDVTPEIVRRGIMAAAARYALSVAEEAKNDGPKSAWRSAAFSAVTIGTKGGSAMTLQSSIAAMLRGAMDVNRMLRAQKLWGEVRIDQIELVELYEERAIAAVYAARLAARQVTNELEAGERIEVRKLLRPTVSGLFRTPLDDVGSEWYQRLVVTVEGDEDSPLRRGTRPMKYVVLSERARAEAELQCRERSATESLIAAAVGQSGFDPKFSGALFELLVPNDIKAASELAGGVVLILDGDTAQYPWEILADPFAKNVQPYAVRSGIIRQFISPDYRPARYALRNRALVVGDTDIQGLVGTAKESYAELRGAQDEARAVAAVVTSAGYETELQIRPDARTLRSTLFTSPYRILHLAGHGRYDRDRPEESGMVLGANDFLTACQLRQLRTVPELVFLNCCFLGRLDERPVDGVTLEQRKPAGGMPHLLAASVAKELIDMGVKVIVAAGWAVDDAAAVTFASTFYEVMLVNGGTFGDAVKTAREAVFRKHSATNTWGAYQCYGNPGFRLVEPKPGDDGDGPIDWCAQREFIDAIRNIAAEAAELGEDGDKRIEALTQRLRRCRVNVPPEWETADTLAIIAEAEYAFGDYKAVIETLERAIRMPNATIPVAAIERLMNIRMRLATGEKNAATRDEHVKRARQLLDVLSGLDDTAERMSLRGSTFKKLAKIDPQSQPQMLAAAAEAYERAAAINSAKGVHQAYPLLNAIVLRWLLDAQYDAAPALAAAKSIVDEFANSDDYYERVGVADYALTEALVTGNLRATTVERVRRSYADAAKRSHAGKRRSVAEHIEFIVDMLAGDTGRQRHVKFLEAVAKEAKKDPS